MPDTAAPGEVRLGTCSNGDSATTGSARRSGPRASIALRRARRGACPGTAERRAGLRLRGLRPHRTRRPRSTADGEIWAQTLWGLRTASARQDADPDRGSTRARRLFVSRRPAASSPANLDVPRHAQRDRPGGGASLSGAQDWTTLCESRRPPGMGSSASTNGPDDLGPHAAVDVPALPASGTGGAPSHGCPRSRAVGRRDPAAAPAPSSRAAGEAHARLLGAKLTTPTAGASSRSRSPSAPRRRAGRRAADRVAQGPRGSRAAEHDRAPRAAPSRSTLRLIDARDAGRSGAARTKRVHARAAPARAAEAQEDADAHARQASERRASSERPVICVGCVDPEQRQRRRRDVGEDALAVERVGARGDDRTAPG